MKKHILLILLTVTLLASCNHTEKEDRNSTVKHLEKEIALEYGIAADTYTSQSGTVKSGMSLSTVFAQVGASDNIIHQLNYIPDSIFDVKKFRAGKNYHVYYTKDSTQSLRYLVYHKSIVHHVIFTINDSLKVSRFDLPIRKENKIARATIETSLWNAIVGNDYPIGLTGELSDVYAWTVDFFGIQKNDAFVAYYEELFADTTSIGIGKIHAAKFHHVGHDYYAFYFENDSIQGYFDKEGNSLKKAFLKAPLRYSRISSVFTYRRKHPIYKTYRPHTGVDYAAPMGTPVHTIGDGVITFRAWKGGGGRTVKIKHNSVYRTAYLHLSKYGNIKVGTHVKQGDIIGYVGTSGASTGPHLDFRIWKNNKPVDPLKMKSPPVKPIPKKYMQDFLTVRDSLYTLIKPDSIVTKLQ